MADAANPTAPTTATDGKPSTPTTDKPERAENPFKGTKHKVKVDGQEREVDYDELVNNYQLRRHSFQAMEQAKAKEKELSAKETKWAEEKRNIIQYARQNPEDFLRRTGVDVRGMSERYLAQVLEEERATPEMRRQMELEAQLAEYEAEKRQRAQEEKKKKEAEQAEVNKAKKAEYVKGFETSLVEAVKKLGWNPDSKKLPKLITEAARRNAVFWESFDEGDANRRMLSADEIAAILHEEAQELRKEALADLQDDDPFLQDRIKKAREADNKKAVPSFLKPKAKPAAPKSNGTPPPRINSSSAFSAFLDSRQGKR